MKFDFALKKESENPLYVQIQKALRHEIITGQLIDGQQLPPLQKLAQTLGVSLFTLEKSLQALIAEGLLIRRPKKGTFVRFSKSQAQLAPKHLTKIVFVISDKHNLPSIYPHLYTANTMAGLLGAAEELDLNLIFCTPTNFEKQFKNQQSQASFHTQGIILFHPEKTDNLIKIARDHTNVPVIVIGRHPENFELTPANFLGVFNDDFCGGYEMAQHLIAIGVRDFGIVSRKIHGDNYHLRVQGFCKAIQEAGIPIPKKRIIDTLDGLNNLEVGQEAAKQLKQTSLSNHTAILCVNDILAAGVLSYFDHCNKVEKTNQFPRIVTGYDHIELTLQHPQMAATIAVDFPKIGRVAIQTIASPNWRQYPKSIRITPQLIPHTQHTA